MRAAGTYIAHALHDWSDCAPASEQERRDAYTDKRDTDAARRDESPEVLLQRQAKGEQARDVFRWYARRVPRHKSLVPIARD